MKIIVASGVESRPARRRAAHRDGHAHRAILKSDRKHCGAGGIGALKKANPFFTKIDLHDTPAKEILSKQAVDSSGSAGLICRRSKTSKSLMSGTWPTLAANPWTQRASAPPSTPTTHAGAPSLSFNLRAASQFRALKPAPESSTKRSGLLADAALTFRQIRPSRNSKGISARVCPKPTRAKRTPRAEAGENEKTRRHLARIRRNYNSLGRSAVGCCSSGGPAAGRCALDSEGTS